MRKLIGSDKSWNGIVTNYFWDTSSRKLVVQRVQQVDEELAQNRAEYNSHSDHAATRYSSKRPMHKVASIPPGLVEQWMKEGFNIFTASDAELRRRLNDPQYRKLRTMPGRL